jgi:hypothetical protein
MDITFSEINNTSINSENYWEVSNTQSVQPKKKKVSFDDILTNMNLVVNPKGVLQYMAPVNDNVNNVISEEPLDTNGYIYNKYFKDYANKNTVTPIVRVPKTIEEYKQMLLEDKINRIRERKRISQIKSTKMLFTNTGTNIGTNNINVTRNTLGKMSFR